MDMFFVNFKATFIFRIFAIKFSKFWRVLSYYIYWGKEESILEPQLCDALAFYEDFDRILSIYLFHWILAVFNE